MNNLTHGDAFSGHNDNDLHIESDSDRVTFSIGNSKEGFVVFTTFIDELDAIANHIENIRNSAR